MKSLTRKCLLLIGILLIVLSLVVSVFSSSKTVEYPIKPFELVAPAGPGGGWDTTIRMAAKVLGETKIIDQSMPVFNKPGGGGGVALAYMQEKKGDPYEIIIYSSPLLLINLSGQTQLSYKDVTPIAMIMSDDGAFAVPKNSPYATINDVMEELKKDPKSVKIGGISIAGSMDHIQFLLAAKAAGVKDLKDIPYISFQGGEHMAMLMGEHIDLLSTQITQVRGAMQSGDIKVIAITSEEKITEGPMVGIPTLKEQGIDVSFVNWRGIFGPPDMPQYAIEYWNEALSKMVQTTEWEDICKANGWAKKYMAPAEFGQFLEKINEDYKVLLRDVGFYKEQ